MLDNLLQRPVESCRVPLMSEASDSHAPNVDANATPVRRQKTISPSEAVVHLMKGNLGPGVLALPLQFVRVGASVGLAVLTVVGIQGVYCMWLIVVTQHAVHRQGRGAELSGRANPNDPLSFEDLGQLAFGRAGRRVVQGSVLVLQVSEQRPNLRFVKAWLSSTKIPFVT